MTGVRNRIVAGDGDRRHGTDNGYRNHGCRCEACSAAHREYHTWATSRYPHGSDGRALHCKCAKCRAAHAYAVRLRLAGHRVPSTLPLPSPR